MSERFDRFVERALYDPTDGFYGADRGRAGGRRGDFVTSAEVGPLFGTVLAGVIDVWWEGAGRPASFPVVDLGTGPGTLVRALASAATGGWAPVGADHGDPWPGLDGGVVIANELLDNVPFRMARRLDGGWAELFVDDGAPGWQSILPGDLGVPDGVLDAVPVDRPFPVLTDAASLVERVLASGPRHVLMFDYGMPTTAELAARGGWLRTYHGHDRGDDPFVDPGSRDITTDIAVDQLPTPDRVSTQAEWLRRHGIDELVEEGRRHWQEHAARPDVAAMRMRSRIREAEALCDPDGLGAFLVLEWHP